MPTRVVLVRQSTRSIFRFTWDRDLTTLNDEEYNKACEQIIKFVNEFYPGWKVHSPRPLTNS